jgi:hypothetical protein
MATYSYDLQITAVLVIQSNQHVPLCERAKIISLESSESHLLPTSSPAHHLVLLYFTPIAANDC